MRRPTTRTTAIAIRCLRMSGGVAFQGEWINKKHGGIVLNLSACARVQPACRDVAPARQNENLEHSLCPRPRDDLCKKSPRQSPATPRRRHATFINKHLARVAIGTLQPI